jgi:hypothetical protein
VIKNLSYKKSRVHLKKSPHYHYLVKYQAIENEIPSPPEGGQIISRTRKLTLEVSMKENQNQQVVMKQGKVLRKKECHSRFLS